MLGHCSVETMTDLRRYDQESDVKPPPLGLGFSIQYI